MNTTTNKEVRIGDRVFTNWALGSKDGHSHFGVVVKFFGGFAKVSWNDAGIPSCVKVETLCFVSDDYHAGAL